MFVGDTKCKRLVETLRDEILRGKYNAQNPLPSIRALIGRTGLSSSTVRHAFDELEHGGLIVRSRGKGTFVTRVAVSRKIGLLIPRKGYSEFFQPVIGEISRLAQQHGYSLLFGEMAAQDPERRARATVRLARDMVRQGVSGVIFQPNEGVGDAEAINRSVVSIFREAGIAVVLCDYDLVAPPERSDCDVVGSNNFEAGMRVAEHLFASGARKLSFVLPPHAAVSHLNRCRGALSMAGMRGAGFRCEPLEADPKDVAALRRSLRRSRLDAFICCNDKCAAELLRTLDRLGLRVPDDVLLAGFDDLAIASLLIPSLTTIHQPCEKIARTAFERLLQRIAHPELDPMKIVLDAPLVVRESSDGSKWRRRRK